MASSSPVIGFTLDHEPGGGFSTLPWYAIRENYLSAVSALGAVPLPLPHEIALADRYVDLIDGLVVTGGAFDLPPAYYGEAITHPAVTVKERRTDFEAAVLGAALKARKPILGICGGEQLLNVVLGGTLVQHVPDAFPGGLAHEQPNLRSEPGHTVRIFTGTLLHRIVGKEEIPVNSAHHQAVATVGKGVTINAVAPDGVIEGIEYAGHPFCLGVEWHPEYHVSPADGKIFAAFVDACGKLR